MRRMRPFFAADGRPCSNVRQCRVTYVLQANRSLPMYPLIRLFALTHVSSPHLTHLNANVGSLTPFIRSLIKPFFSCLW